MIVKITGVPPYDGEYPVPHDGLTNRDLHTIKRITGYVAPFEDVPETDPDFVVALAIIGVQRSGKFQRVDEDALWDATFGKLELLGDPEDVAAEVDADPLPGSAPETPPMPSGAPGPTDGDIPPVRSLPATGTDSLGSWG